MKRSERAQMGVFMLTAAPAFMLLLMFAADAAAVMEARSAADEFAVVVSRYIAADAVEVACDTRVSSSTAGGCPARSRSCATGTGAVPWGRAFLDGAVVAGYNSLPLIAGERRGGPGRPGFDELVERLPANVTLRVLNAATVGGSGSAAGVQATVALRRARLLTEKLLGSSRTATVSGTATSTIYVEQLAGTGRAAVSYICPP